METKSAFDPSKASEIQFSEENHKHNRKALIQEHESSELGTRALCSCHNHRSMPLKTDSGTI